MKVFYICLLLLISTNFIFSQEKSVLFSNKKPLTLDTPVNGKLDNGIYVCNRFKWAITIPDGYEITDPKKIEELENSGYEAINKEGSNTLNLNPHPTHLIGFGIDEYNYFTSSFELLVGISNSLEEHKKNSEQLLIDTYSKIKELKYELSVSDMKIGKLNFYKMQIRLYDSKTDKLLLTQEIYNTFIDNHLFCVSINYTNETIGMLLNYNFIKSLEK